MDSSLSFKTLHKKIILAMLILSIFVFIVALSSLYVQEHVYEGDICACAIPVYLFIPFIGVLGLFIGTTTYYLLSPRFRNETQQKKLLLSLLRDDEARVMKILLESGGESTQARIAKQARLDKLRVFRAVQRLEKRGVVSREKEGKVVVVKLAENYRKLFFSE